MRIVCNVENKIISIERILQYNCIPSEPPLVVEDNQPDRSWPSFGEVHIQDLQVRYAPHLPLVLCGLTCTFPAGAKIGIVGRTGSGKTTLVQTLFKLFEPAAGEILIDSINISLIGIHDLRSRLSIIPQDPTMFEGTVRSNLDPLEEYTDELVPVAMVNRMSIFHGTTARGWKGMDPFYFFMNPSPAYEIAFLHKLPKELSCSSSKSSYKVANYIQRVIVATLSYECISFTRRDKYGALAGNDGIVAEKPQLKANKVMGC